MSNPCVFQNDPNKLLLKRERNKEKQMKGRKKERKKERKKQRKKERKEEKRKKEKRKKLEVTYNAHEFRKPPISPFIERVAPFQMLTQIKITLK